MGPWPTNEIQRGDHDEGGYHDEVGNQKKEEQQKSRRPNCQAAFVIEYAQGKKRCIHLEWKVERNTDTD